MRQRITEYLDIDLETMSWCCHTCEATLGAADRNYKELLAVAERDPEEIWPPVFPSREFNLSVTPGYGVLVEFYCPQCGTMFENELLPEGAAPTWDIQLDLEALQARHAQGES